MTHIFTVDNRTALAPDHTADIVADMCIADFTFVVAATVIPDDLPAMPPASFLVTTFCVRFSVPISIPFKSSVVFKSSSLIFSFIFAVLKDTAVHAADTVRPSFVHNRVIITGQHDAVRPVFPDNAADVCVAGHNSFKTAVFQNASSFRRLHRHFLRASHLHTAGNVQILYPAGFADITEESVIRALRKSFSPYRMPVSVEGSAKYGMPSNEPRTGRYRSVS